MTSCWILQGEALADDWWRASQDSWSSCLHWLLPGQWAVSLQPATACRTGHHPPPRPLSLAALSCPFWPMSGNGPPPLPILAGFPKAAHTSVNCPHVESSTSCLVLGVPCSLLGPLRIQLSFWNLGSFLGVALVHGGGGVRGR